MASKEGRGAYGWLSIALVGIIAAALPFLIYGFLIVEERASVEEQRGFLALAQTAEVLHRRLTHFEAIFKFAPKQLNPPSSSAPSTTEVTERGSLLRHEEQLRKSPHLKKLNIGLRSTGSRDPSGNDPCRGAGESNPLKETLAATWLEQSAPVPQHHLRLVDPNTWTRPTGLRYSVDRITSPAVLRVLDCRPYYDRDTQPSDTLPEPDQDVALYATVPILDLYADSVQRPFREILLADPSGTVVASTNEPSTAFTNISHLLHDPPANGSVATNEADYGEPRNGQVFREKAALLGGHSGAAYVMTLLLPLERGDRGVQPHRLRPWYLVGVADSAEMERASWALPPRLVGYAVVALLLGCLAFPVVKVISIGEAEGLSGRDALAVFGALLLGPAVATITIGAGWEAEKVSVKLEQSARAAANTLKSQFVDELELRLKELSRRAGIIAGVVSSGEVSCGTNSIPHGSAEGIEAADRAYPIFEFVFQVKKDGTQAGPQLPSRTYKTAPVLVSGRDYFKKPIEGDGYRTANREQFYIERVQTYDHDRKQVILSKRFGPSSLAVCDAALVAGIGRMQSFFKPVLGPGFQFAVLEDSSGRVQFHSNDHQSLVANLYNDPGVGGLEAIVRSGEPDGRYGQFDGTDVYFWVEPLPAVPWTLVVFFDKSRFDSYELSAATLAGAATVVYLSVLILGAWILSWSTHAIRWSWTWPDESTAHRLLPAMFVMIAGNATLAAFVITVRGWPLMDGVAAVPVLTIGTAYLLLREPVRAYVARVVITFIAVQVTGAWVFYRVMQMDGYLGVAICLLWVVPVAIYKAHFLRAQRYYPALYVGTVVLALTTLAAWPAAAFLKEATLLKREAVNRLGQLEIARQADIRTGELIRGARRLDRAKTDRLGSRLGSGDADWLLPNDLVRLGRGLMPMSPPGAEPAEELRCSPAAQETQSSPRELVNRPSDSELPRNGCNCVPAPMQREYSFVLDALRLLAPRGADSGEARSRLVQDYVLASLAWALPTQDAELERLRRTLSDKASDPLPEKSTFKKWRWYEIQGETRFCYLNAGVFSNENGDQWLDPGYSPERGDPSLATAALTACLITLGALVFFVVVVSKLSRRLLGLGLDSKTATDADALDSWLEGNLLVENPRRHRVERMVGAVGDRLGPDAVRILNVERNPEAQLRTVSSSKNPSLDLVVLEGFDTAVFDAAKRGALLRGLEQICAQERPRIALLSDHSQHEYLAQDAHLDAPFELSSSERLRWAAVLCRFRLVGFGPNRSREEWIGEADGRESTLIRECGAEGGLSWIAADLRKSPGFENLSPLECVARIRRSAEPTYRKIWRYCTWRERLALVHLARGGIVNLSNQALIERLIRRGLVVRNKGFSLFNQSFASFALTAETPETLLAWKRAETAGAAWPQVRVALLAVLVLLGLLVAYSTRDTVEILIGLAPSALAALSMLGRVSTLVRGKSQVQPETN